MNTPKKLTALRAEMIRQNIDGFLIPRADEYQNEFPPAGAQRLRYITNFTGSGGLSIILRDKAVVMTDGRYLIQVKDEVDPDHFTTVDITKVKPADWLGEHADNGYIVGYDPRLHTPDEIQKITADIKDHDITLKPVSPNPADTIWIDDRPAIPAMPVTAFPHDVAGKTTQEKGALILHDIKNHDVDGFLITAQDSIAWLLNIRGTDIAYTPLALSYAYIDTDAHVHWFIDPDRVPDEVQTHIGDHVTVVHPDNMLKILAGQTVGLDEKRAAIWFSQHMSTAHLTDPCIRHKAQKTTSEQAALKKAHIQDGIALAKFLHWLDQHGSGQTEIGASQKLEEFRAQNPAYQGPSFPTIAGFGANGAIIHYRPTEQTNKTLENGNLLLVDSGGQYADPGTATYGTTDITRTIAMGSPTEEMKDRFTRVLKGHIALASARFPVGTTGAQLDVLARKSLWEDNLDYAHGTGHGVGCYLAVHEDAANLSPRGQTSLAPGMLISNEPGYYKPQHYGIRLENLVLTHENGTCPDTGKPMMYFETVGYAPIDQSLIIPDMLSNTEKQWLNDYHHHVFDLLKNYLDDTVRSWLKHATRSL